MLLLGAGVLIEVPIAFAFALATVAYLLTITTTPLQVLPGRIDEGMSSLILLAVPLFVTLGALIEITGMANAMVAFLASLIGHVRGGLQYVLLGAILLVSGISGSKTADMAAVTPVLFPEMRKRGLSEGGDGRVAGQRRGDGGNHPALARGGTVHRWSAARRGAGGHGLALGRHSVHHRRSGLHGLGADPIRVFARSGRDHDRRAR